MKTFTFCTSPVEFTIESNFNSSEEALDEALNLGTDNEVGFLDYIRENIEEQLTLGGVECMFVYEECD
jgi:hypothetical protein